MLKLWRKVDEYLHSNKNTETVVTSWKSRINCTCVMPIMKKKNFAIFLITADDVCIDIPSESVSDINMLVLWWKNIPAIPFVLLLNRSKVIAIKSKCIVIEFRWCTSSAKIHEWSQTTSKYSFLWQRVLLTIFLSKLNIELWSRVYF